MLPRSKQSRVPEFGHNGATTYGDYIIIEIKPILFTITHTLHNYKQQKIEQNIQTEVRVCTTQGVRRAHQL